MGQTSSHVAATTADTTTTATTTVPSSYASYRIHCIEMTPSHLEWIESMSKPKENGEGPTSSSLEVPFVTFEGTGEQTVAEVKAFVGKAKAEQLTQARSAEEEKEEEVRMEGEDDGEECTAAAVAAALQGQINFYVLQPHPGASGSKQALLLSEDLSLAALAATVQERPEGLGENEICLLYSTEEGQIAYGMDDLCCLITVCVGCVAACCAAVACCACASGAGNKKNNNNNNNNNGNYNYNNNNNNNNYNNQKYNNNNSNYNTAGGGGYNNPIQQQNYNNNNNGGVAGQGYGLPPNTNNAAPAATPNYYNYSGTNPAPL